MVRQIADTKQGDRERGDTVIYMMSSSEKIFLLDLGLLLIAAQTLFFKY
jgi:hypothetical protein